MAVNPDMEALTANQATAGENINKTILTVKEFRMALSLGIDRQAFIMATSPAGMPAFALYGNTIVGDPETGSFYRDTDAAKQVVVDFWGLTDEVGEGKLYPTNDDAIASITGYNLEMAREYFNKAYDIAIEEGLMDEDDVIEIIIGLPRHHLRLCQWLRVHREQLHRGCEGHQAGRQADLQEGRYHRQCLWRRPAQQPGGYAVLRGLVPAPSSIPTP